MNSSNPPNKFFVVFFLFAFFCAFRLSNLTSTVWGNMGVLTYNFSKVNSARGDLASAHYFFQKALEENPFHKSALRYLGYVLLDSNQEKDAIRTWWLVPGIGEELARWGVIARFSGDSYQAIRYLALATEYQPDDARIHYLLGASLYDVHQDQDALIALKMAVELDEENKEYWYMLGKIYARLLLSDQALLAWEKALHASDSDAVGNSNIYYQIGYAKQYLQVPTELASAFFAYRQALMADDFLTDLWQKSDLHFQRGSILLQNEQIKQAISEYERAIFLNPEHYMSYVFLGKAKLQDGKFDEAEDALLIAIRKKPGNKLAYQILAKFYQDLSRFEEARLMYEKIVLIDPLDEEARATLVSFEKLNNRE